MSATKGSYKEIGSHSGEDAERPLSLFLLPISLHLTVLLWIYGRSDFFFKKKAAQAELYGRYISGHKILGEVCQQFYSLSPIMN